MLSMFDTLALPVVKCISAQTQPEYESLKQNGSSKSRETSYDRDDSDDMRVIVELSPSKRLDIRRSSPVFDNQKFTVLSPQISDTSVVGISYSNYGAGGLSWMNFDDINYPNGTSINRIGLSVIKTLWSEFVQLKLDQFLCRNSTSDFHETLLMTRWLIR